jgi:hypothetical protein
MPRSSRELVRARRLNHRARHNPTMRIALDAVRLRRTRVDLVCLADAAVSPGHAVSLAYPLRRAANPVTWLTRKMQPMRRHLVVTDRPRPVLRLNARSAAALLEKAAHRPSSRLNSLSQTSTTTRHVVLHQSRSCRRRRCEWSLCPASAFFNAAFKLGADTV